MSSYIYLPIEVGSRELSAKCLIASIAAERGLTAVVGFQHDLIRSAATLPRGVFFSKGSNNSFLREVPRLREFGHAIAASEEENYGYRLANTPVSFNSMQLKDQCDLYLCLGPDEAAFIERRYGPTFPKAVTGNARTDFLRPRLRAVYERDVSEIKREYGKFILLNTNFGLTNPVTRSPIESFYLLWEEIGCFDDDDRAKNLKIFEGFVHWEQYNTRLTREVLALLTKRPEFTVVIRPHPGEWAEGWVKYLETAGGPNIKLAAGTPHIPFMLAADLVVHPGCATGMEALALGVPALSLMGSARPENQTSVSNYVNVTATTATGALALIEDHWHGGDQIRSQQARLIAELDQYLAGMSSNTLSADNIVRALEELLKRQGAPSDERRLEDVRWDPYSGQGLDYFKSKFGVTDESIASTLSNLRSVMDRFHSISLEKLTSGIYAIGPSGGS